MVLWLHQLVLHLQLQQVQVHLHLLIHQRLQLWDLKTYHFGILSHLQFSWRFFGSGGCSLGLATKCWPGILNNGSDVCCSLERFKGINCATGLTGEPFDKVREMCCVDCKWQDHVKFFKVNPHYLGSLSVPSPPTAPATPASGDLPSWNFEPPAIQLPKLIDMSSGCRTSSATKCWSGILNNGSDVCCFLQRFQGCETGELKGEPFDRVREMCCADCEWQQNIEFFKVNPQYLDSLG